MIQSLLLPILLGLASVTPGSSNAVRVTIGGVDFAVQQSVQVSDDPGVVVQYLDNVFVAHNDLAGQYFGGGAEIEYSNGVVNEYHMIETVILQAVDPRNPNTDYIRDGKVYTAADVYAQLYAGNVVFQTCVERDGDMAWGRKLIIMRITAAQKLSKALISYQKLSGEDK
jgi:hypothetical protein